MQDQRQLARLFTEVNKKYADMESYKRNETCNNFR